MFERIVVVDWSASSTPKTGKDSIWVSDLTVATGAVRTANIATRTAAIEQLLDVASAPGRCLVGVDFSLGFPSGTAAALGLEGPPWSTTWSLLAALIEDDTRNANNRFEVAAELNARISPGSGPFWGCPPSKVSDHLTATKVSGDPLGEWRTVETELRRRGKRPFSVWQLLGVGAVGGQTLVGLAAMSRFVERLAHVPRSVDVWPFTSGFAVPSGDVVLAEVWPSLLEMADDAEVGGAGVRDERQVVAMARHLARIDLVAAFTPPVPPEGRDAAVGEEGWVLDA